MLTQPMVQKIQTYLWWIHNLFITNKLSRQLEALWNCDNVTMITITCIYSGNNKYNKSNNVIINERVPREISKYICSKSIYCVILTKIHSFRCSLNAFFQKNQKMIKTSFIIIQKHIKSNKFLGQLKKYTSQKCNTQMLRSFHKKSVFDFDHKLHCSICT